MKRLRLLILPLAALALEAMPFSAVLLFAEPGDDGAIEYIRRTTSYFSLTPFGYANFGPLLTALLSCLLLALTVWLCVRPGTGIYKTVLTVNALAVITSLLPLFLGTAFYSLAGAVISAALAAQLLWLLYNKRKGTP